jgi:hypothetical protein
MVICFCSAVSGGMAVRYICTGARVEYETAGLGHNEGDKPAGIGSRCSKK